MLHSTGRGMENQAVKNSSTLVQSLNRCCVAEEKDRHLQPLGKNVAKLLCWTKHDEFHVLHVPRIKHLLGGSGTFTARPQCTDSCLSHKLDQPRFPCAQHHRRETSRMATCTAAPRKQPRVELMDLLGSFPNENSWNNFSTIRTTL